jgi:hypothetical protein
MSGVISGLLSRSSIDFQLSFDISPIVFTGGIAQNLPGGALPIIAITEASSSGLGLLAGPQALDIGDYFAHFIPMPGGTLGENQLGNYPFANQAVAGNAIIAQPLLISMLMICTTRQSYSESTAIMQSLVSAMTSHDAQGGTYTVVTPKFPYLNCIRTRMVDVSTAASHQAQNTYQIDFIQPLLTIEAAQAAQNSQMQKLTNGQQIIGQPSYSGLSSSVGTPSSLVTPSVIPTAGGVGPATVPFS